MIKEIANEIELALDKAYIQMADEDYLSYVLLIGRADVTLELKSVGKSEYVIDYQIDRYYDKTREKFYLRYLNRNYQKDGFRYNGDSGIDDLSIEMMIYCHLWDSFYFLKSLVRVASILSGKGYDWNPSIPPRKKWEFIHNQIIEPLIKRGIALGNIVEKAYSSDIRNAFAHSLYNIDEESRTIIIWPKRAVTVISFDDFQKKFLYSVILMNKMQNKLELCHDAACQANGPITQPFTTPDGVRVQIYADNLIIGNTTYPKYRIVRVNN